MFLHTWGLLAATLTSKLCMVVTAELDFNAVSSDTNKAIILKAIDLQT